MSTSFIDRVKREDLRAPATRATSPVEPVAPERQTLTDSLASRQENPSEYVDPKLLFGKLARGICATWCHARSFKR